jgi:hypothetical protein
MKLFFVAPLFLVYLCFAINAQRSTPNNGDEAAPPDTAAFVSADFGFTVSFPAKHWINRDTRAGGESSRGIEYKAMLLDVICSVAVYDTIMPVGESDPATEFFNQYEAALLSDKKVSNWTKASVSDGQLSGIEYRYLYGTTTYRSRNWLIGTRLYEVKTLILGNGARDSKIRLRQTKIADEFLQSFKITKAPVVSEPLRVLPKDFLQTIEDGRLIIGRFGFSMDLPLGFIEVERPVPFGDNVRDLAIYRNEDPDRFKSFEIMALRQVVKGASPLVLAKSFVTELKTGTNVEEGPTMVPINGVWFGYVTFRFENGVKTRLYIADRDGMVLMMRFSCLHEADFVLFDELVESIRLTKPPAAK